MDKSAYKSTVNRKNLEESIFRVLHDAEKPLSTTDIASHLGKSWHTIIRHCLDLEIKGKIYKFNMGRISAWQVKK